MAGIYREVPATFHTGPCTLVNAWLHPRPPGDALRGVEDVWSRFRRVGLSALVEKLQHQLGGVLGAGQRHADLRGVAVLGEVVGDARHQKRGLLGGLPYVFLDQPPVRQAHEVLQVAAG
jgi:hypothetical protein